MEQKEKKLITVKNIEDIRNNIGFHFTPSSNVPNIVSEGLKPLTGDLSSGNLGKEAIDNVFFSYGLEGALQIYNNLLYFSNTAYSLQDLQTNTFSPFIPKTNHQDLSEHLTLIEGFELVRQYMANNSYFVFNMQETEYSGANPTGEQISNINKILKNIKESDDKDGSIYAKIRELDSKIKELKGEDKEEAYNQRNQLAIELYQKSKKLIDEIRGTEEKGGNFDRCDFDFGKLEWHTQVVDKNDRTALPHNAHTKLIKNDGGLIGSPIKSDELFLFSLDGIKPANGIDFLRAMYSQVKPDDSLTMDNRPMLLGLFLEYTKLMEPYIEAPDMSNLEQYPGLVELVEKINNYVESHKQKGEAYRQQQNGEQKTTVKNSSLTFQQIGQGTLGEFRSNPEEASNAFEILENSIRTPEEKKEDHTQEV